MAWWSSQLSKQYCPLFILMVSKLALSKTTVMTRFSRRASGSLAAEEEEGGGEEEDMFLRAQEFKRQAASSASCGVFHVLWV